MDVRVRRIGSTAICHMLCVLSVVFTVRRLDLASMSSHMVFVWVSEMDTCLVTLTNSYHSS